MNNTLLHNMNRTHTHIDVEKGELISLPKDGTDYPPVNADINNLITYGKTTGGEGTPDNPIPLINVSEWNKTVCGRNLYDITARSFGVYRCTYVLEDTNTVIVTASNDALNAFVSNIIKFDKTKDITISMDVKVLSGTYNSISLVMVRDVGTNFIRGNANINSSLTDVQKVIINIPANIVPLKIDVAIWYYIKNQNVASDNFTVEYSNIQLVQGTYTAETMPPYEPYTGNTYPYKLEDVNGILHEAGDLPDGTCDTVNWDTKTLTKRVKTLTVGSGTGWEYVGTDNSTYVEMRYRDSTQKHTTVGVHYNGYCNIATIEANAIPLVSAVFYRGIGYSMIFMLVPFAEVATLNDAGVQAWIAAQIAAKGNIVFQYPLATPQIYKIKQYGKTYGGVVWKYNEKPKSIQYHTNIFTDKNITMQCEVRKLGNRKMSEFYWVTENGDKIIAENGDYILLEY